MVKASNLEGMDKTPAVVTVTSDGRVSIEYSDGRTVYLDVEADSLVMRLHLGLDQIEGT